MSAKVNHPSPADGALSVEPAILPVVGSGASAGGLETPKAFFASMPPETDTAFAIIQHLISSFNSIVASLPATLTRLPANGIEDGMATAEKWVYLNPPHKNVALSNRTPHLMDLAWLPTGEGGVNGK